MNIEEHGGMQFVVLDNTERGRTYYYPKGETVTFKCIEKVCARPSGTHRLIVNPSANNDNKLIIVSAGWLAIAIDSDEWTF